MRLELKHLAPYLPYGLKVLANQRQRTLHGISQDVAYLYYNGLKPYFFKEFKPILRPLSDLTKEIEVNGERFVPFKWLGWNNCLDLRDIIEDKDFQNISFEDAQKLFSLHFDIFNLIPQGLAIDINTLNKII